MTGAIGARALPPPFAVVQSDGRVYVVAGDGQVVTEIMPSLRERQWGAAAADRRAVAADIAAALNAAALDAAAPC